MNHLRPYSRYFINKDVKYLIVDIYESLEEMESINQLRIIFNKFPLRDIVSLLLSIEQERDYSEILFFEMEKRLGELIDVVDLDMLQIFIENLINRIDECIYTKLPYNIDPSCYVLETWINNNVIIMKRIR